MVFKSKIMVDHISCTWASIINMNACHAGIPSYETTAASLVFRHECYGNGKEMAKMEDNLSGA